jgi:hypothetical protein
MRVLLHALTQIPVLFAVRYQDSSSSTLPSPSSGRLETAAVDEVRTTRFTVPAFTHDGRSACLLLGTEVLLSSRRRMTLGVEAIFWFIFHTLPQCHVL